jgi:hypothetical protein
MTQIAVLSLDAQPIVMTVTETMERPSRVPIAATAEPACVRNTAVGIGMPGTSGNAVNGSIDIFVMELIAAQTHGALTHLKDGSTTWANALAYTNNANK